MTDKEIREMQRRIDEGIRQAQERLWERARFNRQSLVVVQDGEIREVVPECENNNAPSPTISDPLRTSTRP